MVPILLDALNSINKSTRIILQSFGDFIISSPELFEMYVSTLIPSLLNIIDSDEIGNEARINAASCLKCLSSLKFELIYPYKILVIKRLQSSLDDPIRNVRSSVSSCRNKWYLVIG